MKSSKYLEMELEIDGITETLGVQFEGTVHDPSDIYLETVEFKEVDILPRLEAEERKGSLALRLILDACYQNLMERRYEFLNA